MIDIEAIRKSALESISLEGLDPSLLQVEPLKSVELDALVISQIHNHSSQVSPLTVTGQLLGIDVRSTLSVTHSFGFPSTSCDAESAQVYQQDMLKNLLDLNYDANTVGWYQSTLFGSFWNQSIIETQFQYQTTFPQSILLIYDPTRTVKSQYGLLALRLTDSFMTLFETQKFTTQEFQNFNPSDVCESIPIIIKHQNLLGFSIASNMESKLESLLANQDGTYPDFESLQVDIDPNELDIEDYYKSHLEYLGDCLDEYGQEQWRWQGWHRALVKEQSKLYNQALKKKQENSKNVSDSITLHVEDIPMSSSLNKIIAQEPSRLETVLILNQMETYCKQIDSLNISSKAQ